MRPLADERRINEFLRALGRMATTDVRLYLTGGATAVLEGWRGSTVDVDLRLEPDTDEILRALPLLKERLDINIELASPSDFIPELPAWRDRSRFVRREGRLDVFHLDPYSQALSKLERSFDQDLEDVRSMVERGLVDPVIAIGLFEQIEPGLFRYPAIDPPSFRARVERAFSSHLGGRRFEPG